MANTNQKDDDILRAYYESYKRQLFNRYSAWKTRKFGHLQGQTRLDALRLTTFSSFTKSEEYQRFAQSFKDGLFSSEEKARFDEISKPLLDLPTEEEQTKQSIKRQTNDAYSQPSSKQKRV